MAPDYASARALQVFRVDAGFATVKRSDERWVQARGTLPQASIYGVAAARWSILAGTLVRLGRLLIP